MTCPLRQARLEEAELAQKAALEEEAGHSNHAARKATQQESSNSFRMKPTRRLQRNSMTCGKFRRQAHMGQTDKLERQDAQVGGLHYRAWCSNLDTRSSKTWRFNCRIMQSQAQLEEQAEAECC